jgi:signal transduction histidine kinase
MISEMNDIVWTINPSNDRFDKLTDRMQNFALPLLSSRKVEFEFKKDEKLQEVFLNMHQRKNVYLIFKEAIHNVAKYADCKEVKVRLGREKHLLKLDISDDGKGFNASGLSAGNGLKNMKSRAEELQGQLEVQSQFNRGTHISLEVPITQIAD